jgi:hypothetical protein
LFLALRIRAFSAGEASLSHGQAVVKHGATLTEYDAMELKLEQSGGVVVVVKHHAVCREDDLYIWQLLDFCDADIRPCCPEKVEDDYLLSDLGHNADELAAGTASAVHFAK